MGKSFGEYNRLNRTGIIIEKTCPKCGKESDFTLFKTFSNLKVGFLTMGEYNIDYFAICPACASVFNVDNKTGIQLENKNIDDFELNISMLTSPKLQ